MSPSLTNVASQEEKIRLSRDPDLASRARVSRKRRSPKLPTISKSFFFKDRAPESLGDLPGSYIFFDPKLNLEPHLIRSQDFVTPPPPPAPPRTPPPLPTPPTTLSPASMTKAEIDRSEKKFTSLRAIKEACTLNDDDFKNLVATAGEWVLEEEVECRKIPRLWKKENWKELAKRFIEGGVGERLWNRKRGGFTASDDLLYTDDKTDITFLAFTVLKFQSEKSYRSNIKRKSSGADGDNETSAPTSTKKVKTSKLSTANVAEAEDEEGEDEDDEDSAEEADGAADKGPLTNKEKTSNAKATPNLGDGASGMTDGAPSSGKGKPTKAKATPKPAAGKKIATPKSTAKKTKGRKGAPEPADASDSSTTDEDEKTGQTVGGKNILKGDPFEAARAHSKDPDFSRESLVGKPGIPMAGDGPVSYEMPTVLVPQKVQNDYLSFSGIDEAPISDVVVSTLDSRGISQPERPRTPVTFTTPHQVHVDTSDPPSPLFVAPSPPEFTSNMATASSEASFLLPISNTEIIFNVATASSEASFPASISNINFSVTVGSDNPIKQQIPQLMYLPANTTFANVLSHVQALHGDLESAQRLLEATRCIVTFQGAKPVLQRQLNLKADATGLESSWRSVIKKVTAVMVDGDDDEVELQFL